MAGVPGCAESRTGELGPGKCQSDAGASGPEEKAAGGGKEGGGVFLCALSYIFNQRPGLTKHELNIFTAEMIFF